MLHAQCSVCFHICIEQNCVKIDFGGASNAGTFTTNREKNKSTMPESSG